MSDSFRFAVYGTLFNATNQQLFSGVFYVKEENGWKIYITDSTGLFGGDGAQPIFEFGLRDGNKDTAVAILDYTPQSLQKIRTISVASGGKLVAVLQNLKWIADFVDHEHIPLGK